MCLERIAAVRAEEGDPPAGPEDAHHLGHSEAVIADVLDHLVAEDQVEALRLRSASLHSAHIVPMFFREGRGGEWKKLARGVDDMFGTRACFGGALAVVFQSDHGPAKSREFLHVHAHATTILQHKSFEAVARGAQDHVEAAFLSRPPDVGGFPAQGGLVQVALIHRRNYKRVFTAECTEHTENQRIAMLSVLCGE